MRRLSPAAVALATIALATFATHAPHAVAQGAAAHAGHDAMGMSEAAMRRAADAWFAEHPATPPASRAAAAAAAATFNATGFVFDLDNNTADIDTAFVYEGDTVLWQWINGSHTATSGTGISDPNMGVLFNGNLGLLTPQFSFTFPVAGTYPFFCANHTFAAMRGVVVVQSLAAVPGSDPRGAGFVSDPAPVPSRGGVGFRFSLKNAGRVRAEVFDVRGRRIAVAFDRTSAAGTFDGAWDGRAGSGERVASGVYYMRLSVPGSTSTRRVVIAD
jgi:plastocyanin